MIKNTALQKEKVPRQALNFTDEAVINLSGEKKGERGAEMLVYSGKKLDHWYWGELIIDTLGVQFSGSKYPILESHNTDRKIGFASKVETDTKIFFPDIKLLDNAHANEFYDNASQGFPYQASISIRPTLVERVEKGEKVEVNGMKLSGPLTVFRKSNFREGSVCVFGVDSKTSSTVFSDDDMADIQYDVITFSEENKNDSTYQEESIMDLKELKEKHANLVSELTAEIKASFSAEVEAKDKEITSLSSQVEKLSTQKGESEKRIADLEKKEALRTEKEIELSAISLFDTKLSQSKLPDRLHEKVKKHVAYNDFVKEGVLDREEFSKAVDAEIADWEKSFSADTPTVKGVSTKKKTDVDNEDVDNDVDRLSAHLGLNKESK